MKILYTSTMMSKANKRRRVSVDGQAVPTAVVVAASAAAPVESQSDEESDEDVSSAILAAGASIQEDLAKVPQLILFDLQKSNAGEVGDALENLSSLVKDKYDDPILRGMYVRELISLGGHTVILLAMKKHPLKAKIQEYGLRCIKYLAQVSYPREILHAIAKLEGFKLVAAAMTAFPKVLCINFHAVHVLSDMVGAMEESGSLEEIAPFARRFAFGQGGIALILKTMKEHASNVDLVEKCCHILLAMLVAFGSEAKEALQKAKAIGTVGSVLDKNGKSKELEKAVGEFMTAFFKQD